MPATAAQSLVDRYTAAFPGSKKRFEEAKQIFPCGVTHDTRMMEPFPVYISHAKGAYKWDVDGHKLIDYFVGHGSHILGHCPDDVVRAVQEQMAKGTHPGACHDLEIEWGQLVQKLVPCAERVRFTGSGTEATLMALRLSRLFTGRPKFLKFQGHFHGWHDYVTVSADPPYDATTVPGVPDAVAAQCVAIPPNDLNKVEAALKADPQIGAVILEPTGGHWGGVPIRGAFLKGLRELCTKHDRLLIFDEVITGFRVVAGRRAGLLRRDAGPDDAGEDPRGRAAGRLRRGPGRHPRVHRAAAGQAEDEAPRHLQREPALGLRRRRDAEAHRDRRTVHEGERRRPAAAQRVERTVRSRGTGRGSPTAISRWCGSFPNYTGERPRTDARRQRRPHPLRRRREHARRPEEHEAGLRAAAGNAA